MSRIVIAAVVLAVGGALSAASADHVIGQGVQGRPHGGHTVQRMLYWRHGLPVPYRYRHHRSRYAY